MNYYNGHKIRAYKLKDALDKWARKAVGSYEVWKTNERRTSILLPIYRNRKDIQKCTMFREPTYESQWNRGQKKPREKEINNHRIIFVLSHEGLLQKLFTLLRRLMIKLKESKRHLHKVLVDLEMLTIWYSEKICDRVWKRNKSPLPIFRL